jgi:glycosyltransferase involved in cell wall biosynthesis
MHENNEFRGGKPLNQNPYKISIIVPVYNGARNIASAFGSIARQTIGFEHLQVIFVDDVSTDDSLRLLEDLASKHANVTVLRCDRNSGYAGHPRNVGMDAASADYLMFLDQDDVYYPEACERLWCAIEESDCDVVGGYYSIYDHDGKIVEEKSSFYSKFDPFSVASVDERPDVLQFRVGIWTKIYRRQMILAGGIRFAEDVPVEDMVFFTELAMVMKGFRYIEVPVVKYSLRNTADQSLTYRLNLANMQAVDKGFERTYEALRRYDRADYYPILAAGTTQFYMDMLIGNLPPASQETAAYIEALRFVFGKAHEYRVFDGSGSAELLTALAARGEYELAALFLRETCALYLKGRRYEDLHKKLKYSRIFKVICKIRGWNWIEENEMFH